MSHLIQHDGNFVSYGHVQGKAENNCALVCGYLEKKSTDMYVQSMIEKNACCCVLIVQFSLG